MSKRLTSLILITICIISLLIIGTGTAFSKIKSTPVVSIKNVSGGIKLSWEKVPSAYSYNVYIKNSNKWKKLGSTKELVYTYKNVKNKSSYTFTVKAFTKSKMAIGQYDEEGFFITYYSTPVLVKTEYTAKGPKFIFNKVKGVTKYIIYLRDNDANWKRLAVVNTNYYVYNAAKNSHKYTFTVRCANDKGEYISYYNTKGLTIKYYSAPSLVSASNTVKGVNLMWKAVKGVSYYNVYRKDNGSRWKCISNVKGTTYLYKGAKNGHTYLFTVRCSNSKKINFSFYQTTGIGKVFYQYKKPVITKMTASKTYLTLSWAKISGVPYYRVYYYNNGWQKIGDTKSTSYSFLPQVINKEYKYCIRCKSEDKKEFVSEKSDDFRYNFIVKTKALENVLKENNLTINTLNSKKCSQLVYVDSSKTRAILRFYEKDVSNKWVEDKNMIAIGFVGYQGVSVNAREYEAYTPKGLFIVGEAFYINTKPSTKLSSFKITNKTYWVGDSSSPYYNKRVETNDPSDWYAYEHMIDYYQYEYGFVIGYNPKGIPGKGSAFFFHLCNKYDINCTTGGCVSTTKKVLLKYLGKLDKSKNPYILIR